MKNPLRKDEFFNRYEATKDRSPHFRAFVVLLLLIFSFIMIFGLTLNKNTSIKTNDEVPKPALVTNK